MTRLHQFGDHRDHAGHMFGCTRRGGRWQTAKRGDVFLVNARRLTRQFAHHIKDRHIAVAALLNRARINLVVNVGDVAHIGDVFRTINVAQQTIEHIEHDDRARIADMRIVINRGSAHIHAHVFGIERNKLLLAAGQRVVKA